MIPCNAGRRRLLYDGRGYEGIFRRCGQSKDRVRKVRAKSAAIENPYLFSFSFSHLEGSTNLNMTGS